MLKINFVVDKNILARAMISRSAMPIDFANYLWEKYQPVYIKLQKYMNETNIEFGIIEELKTQKFFADYLEKAIENKERIENNWNLNKDFINNFLQKILKLDFNLEVNCYVVAPELNNGHSLQNNSFIWGHSKGLADLNYDLVYLVHESLHSFFDNGDITHAIIEKIADVELAKTLNKSAQGYSSHPFLKENHIKIFPFWNLYLNRSEKEIINESKNANIKYDISRFEKFRDVLSKLNINEFVEFLESNIDSVNIKTYYEII